ncbi:lambda-exonuclease family protein [Nonomuraea sp. LPB2021202275-12-8]|uniref:lambda-exonuclease family protein n=1 Tax=Nonomuraea sp. LPB2021202275-12-8 TaxID=3120159 RepID=UPI00300C7D50
MTTLTTPTGRFLGRWASGSPEWHQAREHRMTGSRIAGVVGLSKYASRYSTWCEMAGLVKPDPQNEDQARGHFLEGGVADWFAAEHPEFKLVEAGTWIHADPERDWQLANPDRLLLQHGRVVGGLEIKTDESGREWGMPGTNEIPVHYAAQVQWYMDTLGLDWWKVAVLVGRGFQFREYHIDYNPDDSEWMREQAEKFLVSIAWDEMPPVDGHKATVRTVRKRHPAIDPNLVYDISPELADRWLPALSEEKTALADAKAAKARAERVRAELLDAMGLAGRARYGHDNVARRQAKSGGIPYLVVESDLPTPDLQGVAAA